MDGGCNEHDVFVLKAVDDVPTILGVPLGRDPTFTRCDVFVPREGAPGVWPLERLCLVETEVGTGEIRFTAQAAAPAELLRLTARRQPSIRTGQWRTTLAGALSTLTQKLVCDVIAADGRRIGSIRPEWGERTYRVTDSAVGEPVIAVQEAEPLEIKQLPARLLSGRPFARDRFAFWSGDRRLGTLAPDRTTTTDWTLDMTSDSRHTIDRRLALAVSCLDILRGRD